jgi:glucuronate isomerase
VGFRDAVERLGELAGEDTLTYRGYLAALRRRRERFVDLGATASDHGHPTAFTIELGEREAAALVQRVMTDYVHDLRPLLNRFGTEPSFTIVVFTLDESTYSRELAPLAGYYRALRLGPAWWFYDSPDGIRRYRELVTETAGFYNTAGFNDDTRAFASIPVRHDVARRIDCGYLARLVAEHRLPLDEAHETAFDLAYRLAKETYRL